MSTEVAVTPTDTVTESPVVPAVAETPVDDNVIDIDMNDLTIGEIEIIEDIIDAPIDSLSNPNTRKGKMLRAVGFVIKRRTDPKFRLEDAGNLKVKFDTSGEASDPPVSATS